MPFYYRKARQSPSSTAANSNKAFRSLLVAGMDDLSAPAHQLLADKWGPPLNELWGRYRRRTNRLNEPP